MPRTGTIFAGLSAIGLALFAQSPAPNIRVPVRLVTVPTLVFSKDGRLVDGLETSNFRVFDDGHRQRIALDSSSTPLSIAIVVQANQEVREYLSFITKAGSAIESLLVGESGEAAVIAYADEVTVIKSFSDGDVAGALRGIPVSGSRKARTIDAGLRGLELLEQRPGSRGRMLVLIGQAMDSGSESTLASLREAAEKDNVTVFAVALPEVGKAFVSDNFSLEGLSSRTDRGGFRAGVDLGHLIAALGRGGKTAEGADPFSVLTEATGGIQAHVRRQREFEEAIGAMGVQMRSSNVLSYSPAPAGIGYHTIQVEVDVSGARVHARPGYWLAEN